MPRVSDDHLASRRRQILDAALTCFARSGFHATPMQAIFDEAGLSPGAVYRYFKGKEEIVQAIAAETLGGFADALATGRRGPPDEVLARLFDAIEAVELRDQRLRLALQVWGEAIVNPRLGRFVRDVIDALHARIAAELKTREPESAAWVLIAIAQGSVVQRDVYGDGFDAEGFRKAALALVSQGRGPSRRKG